MLGSRACCCDLDFKAGTVPGADSQRALLLAQPGKASAGPFRLVAPGCASKRAFHCLFLVGGVWPCCLAVFVSQRLPPRVLLCSGPSREL